MTASRVAALTGIAWLASALIGCAAAEAPSRADRSFYLRMQDGTRIALSLYFPGRKEPTSAAATVLVLTRYGRAFMFMQGDVANFYQKLREAGYVVAVVDTRGSTASFGTREVDLGPDEVRDTGEIIAHLAQQPWSDGSVFVTGLSYMGTAADVATSLPTPALKGAIIRHPDFDAFLSFQRPGGVAGHVMELWATGTYGLDVGRRTTETQALDCRASAADCAQLWPWLQPVDDDEDFTQLRQALSERKRWTMRTYANVEFRDDKGTNGHQLFAITGGSRIEQIREQAVPVQLWASWNDADTAYGMLARYRSTPEVPTDLWITGNDHPERNGADPYLPDDIDPVPSLAEQQRLMMDFLQRLRRGEKPQRVINYYVLGARTFRRTQTWPPADAKSCFLALAPGRRLIHERPADVSVDRYEVDFSATTGKHTRWSQSPRYQDRRAEDRKLLVYDSEPFVEDTELVGTPVVTLQVVSATRDPALHVYLEDVAPDGRVTYLTEGVFRAIHRKPARAAALPYDPGPAPHSYLRSDAAPMRAGEVATVEFAMMPIAARIAQGHRVRVAIAGADQDNFRGYSEGRAESIEIHSSAARASGVEIQLRRWTS